MKKMIWCGNKVSPKVKKEVPITFNPATGFIERGKDLFLVVEIDPDAFAQDILPSMIGVKVFTEDKFGFVESATDQEIFDSEPNFDVKFQGWIRPGHNPIKVDSLEAGKEYCFAIYAEYPDQ